MVGCTCEVISFLYPPDRRGPVLRQEQSRIPQSDYHAFLETECGSNATNIDTSFDPKIRYWSDYSRVFFDPKSFQAIPDVLDTTQGDWGMHQETLRRYDDVWFHTPLSRDLLTLTSEH